MSDVHLLTFKILKVIDGIIKKKLKYSMAIYFWDRIGKPYMIKAIRMVSEKELRGDMNMIYLTLKPYFEKKQLKELLDEGNKLSEIDLSKLENKEFEDAARYF